MMQNSYYLLLNSIETKQKKKKKKKKLYKYISVIFSCFLWEFQYCRI